MEKGTIMSLTLDKMVEAARNHKMTPTERRAQRVSLIMGLRSHNSTLTREQVKEILDDVEGHPETFVTHATHCA